MNLNLTSNLEQFKEQLKGKKNIDISKSQPIIGAPNKGIIKVKKNVILSIPSDYSGCGHIRNIFPMNYLNAVFGKSQKLHVIVMPFFCSQQDIVIRAKSIYLQRVMDPKHIPIVHRLVELKNKFQYKIVYDIDDFIWKGKDEGEHIPEYNFGSEKISDAIRRSSVEIMNMCDRVCVSSEFLKFYLKTKLKIKSEVVVVPNTVSIFFWGSKRKKPIKEKIKKPKIIWTASPTHWHEQKKLKGDMENVWCEYIKKNVRDNKIDFMMMGCKQPPFFFKDLKNMSNFKTTGWLNSYQYHLPVIEYGADFSIGPLVPNYFNYSKSCIKMQEAFASGSVFIGTTFTNKFISPYDEGLLTVPDNCTIKDIEDLIDKYSEPGEYNKIIKKQYNMLDEKGWYLESSKFINFFLKVISGQPLKNEKK